MSFVNGTKIYQFKAKNSDRKDYTLCLGNISKDFTTNKMKKMGLGGVDPDPINANNILDIYKYLIKRT